MYIGFYNYVKQFNKNRMFAGFSLAVGDDLIYPFVLMGRQLRNNGHKINTADMDDIKKFDAVVFVGFPGSKNKHFRQLIKDNSKNLHLIILESPIIKSDDYDQKNHEYFKKILTWSDDLVDNKKYFKLNYSHKIPEKLDFDTGKKEKLCALISSNKSASHPNELYSERIKAIRWFEKNHPDDFDLFGVGWDRYYFRGNFFGINLLRLNRLAFLAKLLAPNYPSYKGGVKSKKETYKKYKFAICYENAEGFPGYITEKIFDCFFGGCVPIYLGAPNITRHVPENTFIDKRKFKTYQELYKYIKNMPDKEYSGYLTAIESFLKSEKSYPFSAEYFADIICREITGEKSVF